MPSEVTAFSPGVARIRSMAAMVSRMKPGPRSGANGMSVPNRTGSAPKKARPDSTACQAPKSAVSA